MLTLKQGYWHKCTLAGMRIITRRFDDNRQKSEPTWLYSEELVRTLEKDESIGIWIRASSTKSPLINGVRMHVFRAVT